MPSGLGLGDELAHVGRPSAAELERVAGPGRGAAPERRSTGAGDDDRRHRDRCDLDEGPVPEGGRHRSRRFRAGAQAGAHALRRRHALRAGDGRTAGTRPRGADAAHGGRGRLRRAGHRPRPARRDVGRPGSADGGVALRSWTDAFPSARSRWSGAAVQVSSRSSRNGRASTGRGGGGGVLSGTWSRWISLTVLGVVHIPQPRPRSSTGRLRPPGFARERGHPQGMDLSSADPVLSIAGRGDLEGAGLRVRSRRQRPRATVASARARSAPSRRLRRPHRDADVVAAGLGRRALPLAGCACGAVSTAGARSPVRRGRGWRRLGRRGVSRRRAAARTHPRRRRREPACRATTRRGRDAPDRLRRAGPAPSVAAAPAARRGTARRRVRLCRRGQVPSPCWQTPASSG